MIELFEHQKRGVEIANEHQRFAFFWSPGTGKTMAMLSIWKERPMRTLVVASKSIIGTAWAKDSLLLKVPLKVVHHANRSKRLKLIEEPGDHVLVTNYEQFRAHAPLLLKSGVQRVIFDESSKLKNRKAKTSIEAHKFCDAVREVYLLSGTPSPNCPTELWSQLRCLGIRASTASFYSWAHRYFIPIMQPGRGGKQVIGRWLPKPEMVGQFNESLRPWSEALRKEDCLDLPEQVDQMREVELSKTEREQYDQVVEELALEVSTEEGPHERVKISVAAEAVIMKLRQVVGGAVRVEGKAVEIGSSKIDAMLEALDEIGDEPTVIWCEFRADIDRIERLLRARGDSCGIIDGRTSHNVAAIVDDFREGKTNRIIAHPKAAGHGTDGLQKVCRYAIYFGLSFSAEEHEQSRDRLHRSGQKSNVTYVYLIAKKTIDESLYWIVKKKQTKQRALLQELRKGVHA